MSSIFDSALCDYGYEWEVPELQPFWLAQPSPWEPIVTPPPTPPTPASPSYGLLALIHPPRTAPGRRSSQPMLKHPSFQRPPILSPQGFSSRWLFLCCLTGQAGVPVYRLVENSEAPLTGYNGRHDEPRHF